MDLRTEEENLEPPLGSDIFISQELEKLKLFIKKKNKLMQYKTMGTLLEGIFNAESEHSRPWEDAK
jgi:hypothetical protein